MKYITMFKEMFDIPGLTTIIWQYILTLYISSCRDNIDVGEWHQDVWIWIAISHGLPWWLLDRVSIGRCVRLLSDRPSLVTQTGSQLIPNLGHKLVGLHCQPLLSQVLAWMSHGKTWAFGTGCICPVHVFILKWQLLDDYKWNKRTVLHVFSTWPVGCNFRRYMKNHAEAALLNSGFAICLQYISPKYFWTFMSLKTIIWYIYPVKYCQVSTKRVLSFSK